MVLTVTLNPAVDKTYETAELILGQVNRMRSAVSIPGGKGVNVAKVLRQFGYPVAAMGFLGGYSGRMIEEALLRKGVECHFTRIAGDTRTSTNILSDTGFVTEVLEPGPMVTEAEWKIFMQEYAYCLTRYDLIVLSGSVPGGIPVTAYRELIALGKAAGKKVFLDTSGELLKEGVKAAPYLIKPNWKELEFVAGRKLRTRQDLEEEARRLIGQGIEKVVVSLGEEGLLYADREQTCFAKAPKVSAVNTVGCGDSVVASLCISETEGENPLQTLHRAVSVAAANAVSRESAEISMNRYEEIFKS